ncbi:NlpC/P60 family protein [Sedimentitalea todarodis]|uniref:TIGR02594 family protein n=1 Tax=Sedimentitalea todarodis TaxID=1631240 RepID=A0ABU3VKX6_9RHOB|nr:TIGR02594 family protein [Sedimentitalea todarodis]MDU9006828.1 TIGR02594 family protein [Sedimentitalea todarodis]
MNFIEWIQKRLISHGFNPGTADGIWGRNTLNATLAFQRSRNLPAEGVLNKATIDALGASTLPAAPASAFAKSPASDAPARDLLDMMPWMSLALRKRGMHEGRDNPELREFLKSDGKTLGDPAQLPWCGDFVETCIAVTMTNAVLPGNPYLARNWLKFGQTVDPCFGSVLVFWRKKRSGTSGHVGFYYSEDADTYHVLGGNQSNSVSVTSLRKERLLGARLPLVGGPYARRVITDASDWELSENEF